MPGLHRLALVHFIHEVLDLCPDDVWYFAIQPTSFVQQEASAIVFHVR
jgi:hypothetical protein